MKRSMMQVFVKGSSEAFELYRQAFDAEVLCEYPHEPLQYLLIDGEFCGACVGHFRNGPYDLNDVVCCLPDSESRRDEIISAVAAVNFGKNPQRFMGNPL